MADVIVLCIEQVADVIATGSRWNSHVRMDFILSSEMLNRTLSLMWGRWYLPIFLFMDGDGVYVFGTYMKALDGLAPPKVYLYPIFCYIHS